MMIIILNIIMMRNQMQHCQAQKDITLLPEHLLSSAKSKLALELIHVSFSL